MKIIWSDEARKTYDKTIDELIVKWQIDIAIDFEDRTNSLLDHLKEYKKFCPPSKKKRLRKCVIHNNASLIYRIKSNCIELITFIDNRTNHNY